jgi:hypothetical protein
MRVSVAGKKEAQHGGRHENPAVCSGGVIGVAM